MGSTLPRVTSSDVPQTLRKVYRWRRSAGESRGYCPAASRLQHCSHSRHGGCTFNISNKAVLILLQSANQADVVTCERQWQGALDAILSRSTLGTLQCLVLAQMHSIAQGNHTKLLRYKGIAIGLSQRLGLHQCQKRFSLGALTCESRKKVFWTLYTLDW